MRSRANSRPISPEVKPCSSYFSDRPQRLLNAYVADYLKEEVAAEGLVRNLPVFSAFLSVVNHLAQRGELRPGSELYGKAFENWVFHELTAHNAYAEAFATLSYWRLASGIEVDFIVNDMQMAIEAKAAAKITADHLKGLRALVQDHPRIRQRLIVCLESKRRRMHPEQPSVTRQTSKNRCPAVRCQTS